MTIYDYSVPQTNGEELKLDAYKGKVMLIVNTATGCGFTPHYEPLEKMYEEFHDKGFEIIDIPCNQFMGQTPGTDEEIHEFCTLKYNTKFPQMKKSEQGFKGFGSGPKAIAMGAMLKTVDKDYKNNPDIKWNFTKFLVDREGNVVRRFEPTEDMKNVAKAVEELI